jgi:hypothetical protein
MLIATMRACSGCTRRQPAAQALTTAGNAGSRSEPARAHNTWQVVDPLMQHDRLPACGLLRLLACRQTRLVCCIVGLMSTWPIWACMWDPWQICVCRDSKAEMCRARSYTGTAVAFAVALQLIRLMLSLSQSGLALPGAGARVCAMAGMKGAEGGFLEGSSKVSGLCTPALQCGATMRWSGTGLTSRTAGAGRVG